MNAQDLITLLQDPDVRKQIVLQVVEDLAALPPEEKLEIAKILFPGVPWDLMEKLNVANIDWNKALEKLAGILPKKQTQQPNSTGSSFMDEVRARMKKN